MLRRAVAGLAVVAAVAAFRADGAPRGGVRLQAAPSSPSSPQPRAAAVPEVTPTTAVTYYLVATAKVPTVAVYGSPGDPQPARTIGNPDRHGITVVFLVQEQRPDWLKVLLPVRPNGSSGWIRPADVQLTTHDFRIVVELGAHRITVWKGNTVFDEEPVGVGTEAAPTPGGLYYTTELVPNDPASDYGAFAYGLSGFSDVYFNFGGEDGQLAIHGTNNPASIGKSVSHGCIRMTNEAITRLAHSLPLGVPVEVRA